MTTSFEYPQYWDNNLQPARKFVAASSQQILATSTTPTTFTMACWFTYSMATTVLISPYTNGSSDNRYALYTNATKLHVASVGVAGVNLITLSTNTINSGWNHALGVFSGSSYRRPVLNGVLSPPGTGTITLASDPDRVVIGQNGINSVYHNGSIALPCIWNAALNTSEIKALSQGAMPWTIRPQSIVSCPDMQTLYDPFLDARWTNSGSTLAKSPTKYIIPKNNNGLPTRQAHIKFGV